MMSLTNIFGWIAVGLGSLSAFAQFTRLRRHGEEGVSLETWTLLICLTFFWFSYGLEVHSGQVIFSSALSLPLQAFILIRLRPFSRISIVLRSFGLVVMSCATPGLLWGWAGAAAGAGGAGLIAIAPQLIRLTHYSEALGVSTGAWAIKFAVSALLVAYYAGAHLWVVLIVTVGAGTMSLAIAMLSGWRHHHPRTCFELSPCGEVG